MEKKMVGITLSPEQINQAPVEVRRWLEQQLSATLGVCRPEPALPAPQRHMIGCDLQDARAILSLIHGLLPVVSVFFELGRDPIAVSPQGLRALRLDEIVRHARLESEDQAVACLKALDEPLQHVCGPTDAVLTALDGSGHCLVSDATARSILALWQEIVAAHNLRVPHRESPAPASTPSAAPHSISMPTFTTEGQLGNTPG
jgi:hypothetical protein